MKAYFITRFSIFDVKSDSWVLTRNNKDEDILKASLFSDERLSEKIWSFKNITYRSIKSQIGDYMWHIYTSKMLPEYCKQILYSMEDENIKIIEVDSQAEFFEKTNLYEYGSEYATIRIDDDDALHPSFVERINSIYQKSNAVEIVSFPNGIKIKRGGSEIFAERNLFSMKKIALGLAMFNGNIYCAGSHTQIDQRYEVLYDYTPGMYLVYSSGVCDTGRKFDDANGFVFDLEKYFSKKELVARDGVFGHKIYIRP